MATTQTKKHQDGSRAVTKKKKKAVKKRTS
jgi:hypothetical protein